MELPDDMWTSCYCQVYPSARRVCTASRGSSDTSFAPERSQPSMDKLPGDRTVHPDTGARSFPGDKPTSIPYSHLGVSSQSHECI